MEDIPYDQLKHAFEVLQELDEFREAKQQCDFVIKVGTKEIHVHRNVLCANSEYFKAMLSHDTLENQSGMVELKDMDAECVVLCADFMYGRKISISREKWEDLMHCADRLQLHKLRKFLEEFLESALTSNTFYDIKRIANTYHCTLLVEKCDKFARENFAAISKLDGFNLLPKEYVMSLLQSELTTASEVQKLDGLLRWMKYDMEGREKFLTETLQVFDLKKVPVQNLRYLMEKEQLTSQSLACMKLLSGALMDSLNVEASSLDYTVCSANSLAIFDDTSRHLQYLNPENNTWTKMHELHPAMKEDNFSAITLHNNIFVLMQDRAVYRLKYDELTATWQRMSDMIQEHGQWPPAMSDSQHIYVAGCWNSSPMPKKSIDKLDILSNQWTGLTDHEVTQDSSCILYNRKIYCFGGRQSGQPVKTVEVYDLDSYKWSIAAPLLNGRMLAGAAAFFEKIYVVGGEIPDVVLSSVECFDIVCDSWTLLKPMISTQTASPIFTIDGIIYCVGTVGEPLNSIQKYKVANNEWTATKVSSEVKFKLLWPVALHIKSLDKDYVS